MSLTVLLVQGGGQHNAGKQVGVVLGNASVVRVSLLYNASAGDGLPLDHIQEAVAQHGHDLVRVVEKKEDLQRLLEDPPDIVVAAGGDGTVGAAMRLLAHKGIPLSILPFGTANNIASSLEIPGSIDEVVGSWKNARHVPLDLGVVEGSWGRRYFVEAVGGGLIPIAIAEMQSRSDGDHLPTGMKVAGAVRAVADVLSRLEAGEWTIVADAARISGRFLLVEVLNIRSIGPNVVLSEDANPADGFFHLVLAGEEDRDAVAGYLHDLFDGRGHPPSLTSHRARRVTLQLATDVHVDDEVLPGSAGQVASIHMDAGAVELLLPSGLPLTPLPPA